MNNRINKNVEEEFRSSQIYKILKGSGVPAANAVAQGLNKAAAGIDGAINEISGSVKQSAAEQKPRQTDQQNAAQPTASRTNQANQADTYSYQYNYNTNAQQTGKTDFGTAPTPGAQMPQMKMIRRGSPAKFYITGAAALFYSANFPLYELQHYLVFLLVLIGVFFVSGKIFKGKKEFVPVEPVKVEEKPRPAAEEQSEKKSKTGIPEVDKIIDDGNVYIKKLRAANDAIPDEALSDDIDRMERASADIFRFIADHPEKASQIRKFMNYYLPTTLKLLNSYQRLSAQSVKGENITSTMFNIAGMMHTVADAFEKQLDSLFTDEAMDVSADISVFETLLKQEGFVEEKK